LCAVPECRGALISRDGEDALRRQVRTVQPARRRGFGPNPGTVAERRGRAPRPRTPRRGRAAPAARCSRRPRGRSVVVAGFRRRTLLPPDGVLGRLRESIPRLIRSALHRCLVRRGISRPPGGEGNASGRGRFAETTIGHVHVHVDVRGPRLAEGGLFVLPAIDRVGELARAASLDADAEPNGAAFLREVVAALPCRLRAALTDDGTAFADPPRNHGRHPEIEAALGGRIFGRVRRGRGTAHKPTEPYHPWANGRAERTSRTAEEATAKAFHHPDPEALKAHPRPRLRGGPRLRQAPEAAALADTLPGGPRRLEGRPLSVQGRPAPPHPETAHLEGVTA
jgi:hypothetical protein